MPVAPPNLEFRQEKAIEMIHEMHGEVLDTLTSNASIQERDTWPVKQAAAEALLAGTASAEDINMLEVEAVLTGITKEELATKIVQKSFAFKHLVGKAAGLRAAGIRAIMGCQSMEQVSMTMAHIENKIDQEVIAFTQAMEASS